MSGRTLTLAAAAILSASSLGAQTPRTLEQDSAMTSAEMESMEHMPATDVHMRMTAPRPAAAGDSARAATLVADIRHDLAKYRSVDSAVADGFRPFHPEVPQPVYHYTNLLNAVAARYAFNPALPTSLLYRKNGDGSFTLTGVMYTAPRAFSDTQLNERVPLSMTHWHEHVNWCVPMADENARWKERQDGQPVFGPHSPIATKAACDAVGGRFLPLIFNWMVHVNAFASDDPAVIWGESH